MTRAWGEHTQRMRTTHPEWPEGHPLSAVVSRCLIGRRLGELDVSGRPVNAGCADVGAVPGAGTSGGAGDEALRAEAPTIVVDDADGALTAAVLAAGAGPVVAHMDFMPHAHAVRRLLGADDRLSVWPRGSAPEDLARAVEGLGGRAARAVIAAPKTQAGLAWTLHCLAGAVDEVIVVGRDKHLFRGINAELARVFERVDVSPGALKSRMIIGSQPKGAEAGGRHAKLDAPDSADLTAPGVRSDVRAPQRSGLSEASGVPELKVWAVGGCFGGTAIDAGSALLLRALADHSEGRGSLGRSTDTAGANPHRDTGEGQGSLLDLGCGNGWLLTAAAHMLRPVRAVGADASVSALASAERTAAAGMPAGVEWSIEYSDAGQNLPDAAFDLVLLNPPFHARHALERETARTMIVQVRRVLRAGGRMVMVFNSALRYRPEVERVFGADSVEQWARDRRFTVLSAVVPA